MKGYSIQIVSDVMCPWCYIGKRRLEKALEMLKVKEIVPKIQWLPFQLDATLPKNGKKRETYLNEKFGGKERASQIYKAIEDAGKGEGLEFKFEDIEISPNTLDAHRVIYWAGLVDYQTQDKVVEILFHNFFMQGKKINEYDVLIQAAKEAGMDVTQLQSDLESDKDVEIVQQEIYKAHTRGVNGVPCFIINEKYALSGAQEPQAIAEAVMQQ